MSGSEAADPACGDGLDKGRADAEERQGRENGACAPASQAPEPASAPASRAGEGSGELPSPVASVSSIRRASRTLQPQEWQSRTDSSLS